MDVQALIEMIETASGSTIIVFVLVYVLVNYSPLSWFELFAQFRDRKLDSLRISLEDDSVLSSETQMLFRDVLEARLLQRNVGFYAERKMREALLQLYNRTSYKIDWSVIRLALRHLEVRDERIRVKPMSGWRKRWWWLNWLALIILTGILILCLLVALYLFGFAAFDSAQSMAVQFVILAVAYAIFLQGPLSEAQSWRAAQRINKEIENRKLNTEED